MGEVIELKDPFSYIFDGAKIVGVVWSKNGDYVEFGTDGAVMGNTSLEPHELKTLMIMWLSLEYPEVINFDDQAP